ncbi:MAG: RDD family protein [Bacteroidia bacterium]|nr:RDD family protein [Bacteroidia bacterium]
MENIVTPETITEPAHPAIRYAGFWRRFAAYVIDMSILHILLMPVAIFFLRNSAIWNFVELSSKLPPGMSSFFKEGDPLAYALIMKNIFIELSIYALCQGIVILLYYSIWESSGFQATPGKLAVRIKVQRMDGTPISFPRSFARNFCKILSGAIFLIGYMLAGWTEKKQALHDLIAECVIVHTEPDYQFAAPQFIYAGFWRRFVAWLLDMVLIYIILSPIRFIFMPVAYNNYFQHLMQAIQAGEQIPVMPLNDILIVSLISTFSSLFTYFYFATWESSRQQATPGKLAIGIKVVDLYGQKLSFWRASGRYANKIISGLTLLVGYVMAGWTKQSQALHDKLGDTLVIVQRQQTGTKI